MQKNAKYYFAGAARPGESNPAAKLSDEDVELIHRLREEEPAFWTYARIAEKFDISVEHAKSIALGRRRGRPAVRVLAK